MRHELKILFVLVFAEVVASAQANSISQKLPISVETNTTWSTLLQPEVNLLIRNNSIKKLRVQVNFGYKKVECQGELNTVDSHYSSRMASIETFHRVNTVALIPRGGWVHRSYPIAKDGLIAPCKIPYIIKSLYKPFSPVSGVVDVPDLSGLRVGGEVSMSSLSVEYMVEKDELAKSSVILRLLVYNNENYNLRVSIMDRYLSCKGNGKVKWSLRNAPLREESVGPLLIKSKKWGVFVSKIDLEAKTPPSSCEGWASLSAQDSDGNEIPVRKINFSLSPIGIYASPKQFRMTLSP